MVASQRHDPARPLIPHPAISATWGGGGGSVNPQGHLDTRAPGKSYFDQEEANLMYFIDFTPLRAS